MADQLLTAAQVLQEIRTQINQTDGNATYFFNHIRRVRQMQANFRNAPVIGRLGWLKRLIYNLNNSTFSQQFNQNDALLNLIEMLYQEFEQQSAVQNQKLLSLEQQVSALTSSEPKRIPQAPTVLAKPQPEEVFVPSKNSSSSEPSYNLNSEELVKIVQSFPYWYQRIYLGQGVHTMSEPAYHEEVWYRLRAAFPESLQNTSVLDVGCNAGYFSIQLKQLGAERVTGLEFVDNYLAQAELCRRILNLDIEYLKLDAHQLDQVEEKFDIVVFTGILYHLKNPLSVLEQVGRICNDAVLIETEIMPEKPGNSVHVRWGPMGQMRLTERRTGLMKFVEKDELNTDGSNWWIPDTECVKGMLRTAGFQYFSPPCYAINDCRLIMIASKKSHSILNLQKLS